MSCAFQQNPSGATHFVMAALIGLADAQSFVMNGDLPSESGCLRNPHTPAHIPRTAPGPHNGMGPGGIGKAQSAKASSMILVLLLLSRRQAATKGGPTFPLQCDRH